jgi:EAL domain-containing protein (putative c-di-GMP-specific phosphodiesterase class I)
LDLIAALERGDTPAGLFLVMQPEISLTAPFESLNFEVLLRLRKANGQVLPAGIIINAAEAHGKTAIIDRWVVNATIDWLETHAESLGNTRFVGVNLSGGSLNDETFTAELFALFEQHPLATSMICIEITETVALTDMQKMQRFIDRVRSYGVKVGLDDFGAGYSSFGYLKQLSVDALKLDGSLVRDAAHSPSGRAIVEALAGLVNSLGMKSIGEFAEDLPTIKVLAAAGVDYAQGYGISKPVMPERILAARSGAEFIEDPEIMAFIQTLQRDSTDNMSLFGPSAYLPLA